MAIRAESFYEALFFRHKLQQIYREEYALTPIDRKSTLEREVIYVVRASTLVTQEDVDRLFRHQASSALSVKHTEKEKEFSEP
jgi:hypothetical protein